MSDPVAPVVSSHTLGFRTRFPVILGGFSLLLAISLPILLSFDLWVFKDRSSSLNLDYLIEKHYRLGIDAYYSYGLLPVYIQHVLFAIFGRGYGPMLGCTLVVMVLMALFWALLLGQLTEQPRILWGIVAIGPIILSINPNFPYSLVILSIEFALYFVLKKRLDVALAIAVVGCFSVSFAASRAHNHACRFHPCRVVVHNGPQTLAACAKLTAWNTCLRSTFRRHEPLLRFAFHADYRAPDSGFQILQRKWNGKLLRLNGVFPSSGT